MEEIPILIMIILQDLITLSLW